jgi:c-di-GMP-binding flagellar brake protein YcgR
MQPLPNSDEAVRKTEGLLRINDRLQVTIIGTDEEIPTTYLSRVEDHENGVSWIGWPTQSGIRAPLRDNDKLAITYIEDGGVFQVTGRVTRRVFEPLPLIGVVTEGSVQKVQRRDYVRVPAMLDIQLFARVVTAGAGPEEASTNLISTRTVNLSGGGFMINHSAPPRLGSIYETRLRLPIEKEPLKLTAKVVRCESNLDPVKGTYYSVGFAFVQLQENVRRRIVSYIFRLQQSSLAEL